MSPCSMSSADNTVEAIIDSLSSILALNKLFLSVSYATDQVHIKFYLFFVQLL